MHLLDDDPVAVAPRLLGAVLHGRGVSVRLTEVEAYRGVGADPGSHAFRGPTPRTMPMFGPAGTVYVYLSYGLHRCLNLVCGPEGEAGAVLLRAGEVVAGAELAQRRRAAAAPRRTGECASRLIALRDLARGPARLATALGIELADSGGMLAVGMPPVEGIALEPAPPASPDLIAAGPRVGVSGPGGSPEYPWRFWLAGDPTVSTYRPSPRGAGATRAR
ncbi:DNA-3-methyladenine glycosylase [Microcella sp.]|uniref:DNA-3-methyladenine glycosylase n=1 Tax=Microcella sp. TaxID=1913979 RepID=UPI00391C65CB